MITMPNYLQSDVISRAQVLGLKARTIVENLTPRRIEENIAGLLSAFRLGLILEERVPRG